MVNIDFQPDTSSVPSGYIKDIGDAYSSSRGFGWVREDSLSTATHTPLDIKANSRDRNRSGIDQRLDTIIHMQYPQNVTNTTAVKTPAAWEYNLANGTYDVTVSVGDQGKYDSLNTINVEGVNAINRFQGSSTQEYKQSTVRVNVTDGKLTVDAIGGTNTKINYIDINSVVSGENAPEIELQNLDVVPSNDRLVFSRIGSLSNPPANAVHDVSTLRVKNTGTAALNITDLEITGKWQLTNSFSSTSIAAGSYLDVSLKFIANSGSVHTGTLTIKSNDSDESSKVVTLAGFWQSVSEGGQEPTLEEIKQVFGYTTKFTSNSFEKLNRGGLVQTVGDEVFSPYWQRADTSKSVSVTQLAAYHTYGNTVNLSWYSKGSTGTNSVFTTGGTSAQSLLPDKNNSTQTAAGTFTPSSKFGFRVDKEWSDPTLNNLSQDADDSDNDGYISPGPNGHHVRFFRLKNQSGNVVNDTWLMVMDYNGINYDFNDNVYLVSNITPEDRTALYRIDVGSSSSYTDTNGKTWSSDKGTSGVSFTPSNAVAENGGSANPNPSIYSTNDDKIYQTYRGNVGSATPQANRIINYNFNVAAGTKVEVRLHFAELYWGAPGRGPADTGDKRVFDVIVEGTTVINDYNISLAAGGAVSATETYIRGITVGADGVLNLSFKAETDFASIAGIEILTA